MSKNTTLHLAMGLSTTAGIFAGGTSFAINKYGYTSGAVILSFALTLGLTIAAAETARRVIRRDPSDVYILVDRFPDDGDATNAILSVHARRQGAELAAIAHAQLRGPLDHPGTGSDEKSIEMAYRRLAIGNRDVRDNE